ncbi:MAG: hypothetical protein H7Z17_11910 [Fuerstia sp.]|nr:hypothetical protein [Fuerstiella sp.]
MSRRFCSLMLCGLAGLTAGFSSKAQGCDCQTVRTVSMAMPIYGGFAVAPQMMQPMMHDEGVGEAYTDHGMLGPPVENSSIGGGELGIMPSGTLGQTYTRVSHPVPLDKHPRTGMLAVKDHGTVPILSVGVMGGIKMKNGIWLFESTRPLDPGACQIVRVEARQTPQDIEPYATRFVRLIPGRIVYLEF